jgi:hypothetical protein
MQYEVNDTERPHGYTFDQGWEIAALRAAFTEVMFRRTEKGNSGSISDSDVSIADYPHNSKIMVRQLRQPEEITDVLEEFYANTDEAIGEIPSVTNVPAFRNREIAIRFKLGHSAKKLAHQMLEASAKVEMETDRSNAHEHEIASFRQQLDSLPEAADDH